MEHRENLEEFLLSLSNERVKNEYKLIKNTFINYFPEFKDIFEVKQENKYHIYNLGDHTLYAVASSHRNIIVRLVLALHDIGKATCKTFDEKGVAHFYLHPLKSMDISKDILERYGFKDHEKERILSLIKNHDRNIDSKAAIRRLLREVSEEDIRLLLEIKIGDAKAQNPIYLDERLKNIENIRQKLNEIIVENKELKVKDLAINGNDLINLGISDGKEIGSILNRLLELIKKDIELNTKDKLLEKVKNKY